MRQFIVGEEVIVRIPGLGHTKCPVVSIGKLTAIMPYHIIVLAGGQYIRVNVDSEGHLKAMVPEVQS